MYLGEKIEKIRYVAVNYCVRQAKSNCCLCFWNVKQSNKVRLMYAQFKNTISLVNKLLTDQKPRSKVPSN